MANYMPAQALLKTLIATCASFGAGEVVEGDANVLERGVSQVCIIYPGAMPQYDLANMTREHRYEALADLVVRYTNYTTYNAVGTLRDAVMVTLRDGRCMDATYWITGITADAIEELRIDGAQMPTFLIQRMHIEIVEQV